LRGKLRCDCCAPGVSFPPAMSGPSSFARPDSRGRLSPHGSFAALNCELVQARLRLRACSVFRTGADFLLTTPRFMIS